MSARIQFSPAFSISLAVSILWFAFWGTAFRPQATPPLRSEAPAVSLMPMDALRIPTFRAPTLFARPSAKGFSGVFPPEQVALALRFAPPKQPLFFLETSRIREGDPNRAPLFQSAASVRTNLRLPAAAPAPTVASAGLRIALSPSLQPRAETLLPTLLTEWPAYARAQIRVEPDGTVSRCFFEMPLENPALSAEIRSLRFAPADTHTDGWIELRNTPEGDI